MVREETHPELQRDHLTRNSHQVDLPLCQQRPGAGQIAPHDRFEDWQPDVDLVWRSFVLPRGIHRRAH